MSTTYQECPTDVQEKALFAANPDSPPLTHGGYPAAAIAKINSLKDRVAGLTDASITIDYDFWDHASDESKEALLDHELHHLEPKRNKVGALKYDDANRPMLKMRKHDFHLGGFHTIAKRHGMNAVEVQAITHVNMTWRQMELDFTASGAA